MQYLSPYLERNNNFNYNNIHDSIYRNTYILGFLCVMYIPTIFTIKYYINLVLMSHYL